MPLLQIFETENDMRLYDGPMTVTFEYTGYRFNTGFSKSAATKILLRMGYDRSSVWETTDWGWQAEFERLSRLYINA